MSTTPSRLVPTLALCVAMLLWGSSFIAMKVAVTALDPLVVILGRMAVATLLFSLAARRFLRAKYQKGDWVPMLLMALCEPGLYFLFEAYGLTLTTAAQGGMVTATLPVLVTAAAFVWLKERPSLRIWAGFLLAMGGVVWLSLAGDANETAPNPALGNLMVFMAMICATGYTLLLKKLSVRYSPWLLTAVQALVGTIFYLPGLLFVDWSHTLNTPTGMLPWMAILYLGAVVSIGAYGCYNFGMSRLPASQASAFINGIPVVSVVLAWVLLDERLNASQLLACVVVFAGVLLSQGTVKQAESK